MHIWLEVLSITQLEIKNKMPMLLLKNKKGTKQLLHLCRYKIIVTINGLFKLPSCFSPLLSYPQFSNKVRWSGNWFLHFQPSRSALCLQFTNLSKTFRVLRLKVYAAAS